jgi:hypothetical protein
MLSHFINEPDHWRARAEEAQIERSRCRGIEAPCAPRLPRHAHGGSARSERMADIVRIVR